MKKVLLCATALVGVLAMSAPANAAGLNMGVGGHFRGYGIYADNDETGSAAAGDDLRQFDLRQESELHFMGESTLDNGLTVGAKVELKTMNDTAATSSVIDESYLYFSGGWGRFNFGSADGAAYLLQVAAPSADSNTDGMRVFIQGLNSDVWNDNLNDGDAGFFGSNPVLDYDNAVYRQDTKITYLTPKFSGFQAGLSYMPETGFNLIGNNVGAMNEEDNGGDFEDVIEAAARWDGEFEGFGISAGLGWIHASEENAVAAGAGAVGSDSRDSWDAGLNVTFNGFSLGGAYLNDDNGRSGANSDTTTWVVGAGWDNGPWHVGATWMDYTAESSVTGLAANTDLEIERLTIGGGYKFAPGVSFRGAVAFGEVNPNTVGVEDTDFVQGTIGTEVKF